MQVFVVTDELYSAKVYALKLDGKAMLPTFEEGDVILADPAVLPYPDAFVVACIDGKETVFRRCKDKGLNEDGIAVFEVSPLNDAYPSPRSDRHELRILGTMVEYRKYYPKPPNYA